MNDWIRADDARALLVRFRAEAEQIERNWHAAIEARIAAGKDISTACEDTQRALALMDRLDARFKQAIYQLPVMTKGPAAE